MLKGTKSMNLSYSSIIDGRSVVYMSAQVPETGKSNCTKTIQDQEMYEANKAVEKTWLHLTSSCGNWKIRGR